MSEGNQQSMIQEDRESNAVGDTESSGVEISNIRKEYGGLVAVNNIDLRIEPEELFVLLGPSGCGKSTTLRLVAGLESPTDGKIAIGDRDVTNTLPRNRNLSMVFQSYALYPHKNVRENLKFPLNKMDMSDKERETRIQKTAEMLEITDLLEKSPGQLSGGQQQRVAVGRTIVREPDVFLMDEPLSNLDAKLRVQTRGELRQLQLELATTTLYVTHDQEEAMSIADRIGIMNNGNIVQVGTPKEVYESPKNEFVAGFLGEPAINFLSVSRSGGKITSIETLPTDLFEEVLPERTQTIGIRPEDIYITQSSEDDDNGHDGKLSDAVEFTVGFIEPLGNAYELEINRDSTSIRVHMRNIPTQVNEGSSISVTFDLEAIHAFDEDGNSVKTTGY